jgi:hypothetical protein
LLSIWCKLPGLQVRTSFFAQAHPFRDCESDVQLGNGGSTLLEVANTVLRLMPKYSIAMHGNAWHCSIAEDASGKDLCFDVVTVLYKSTTSCQARFIRETERPTIHKRLSVLLALSIPNTPTCPTHSICLTSHRLFRSQQSRS